MSLSTKKNVNSLITSLTATLGGIIGLVRMSLSSLCQPIPLCFHIVFVHSLNNRSLAFYLYCIYYMLFCCCCFFYGGRGDLFRISLINITMPTFRLAHALFYSDFRRNLIKFRTGRTSSNLLRCLKQYHH